MEKINILIPCTKTKKYSPNPLLVFDNIKTSNIIDTLSIWKKNMLSTNFDKIKVRDYYSFDDFYLSLFDSDKYNIFVLSSGYGIINIDDYIIPYDITFNEDEFTLNSIRKSIYGKDCHRYWFSEINNQYPKDLIINVSKTYEKVLPFNKLENYKLINSTTYPDIRYIIKSNCVSLNVKILEIYLNDDITLFIENNKDLMSKNKNLMNKTQHRIETTDENLKSIIISMKDKSKSYLLNYVRNTLKLKCSQERLYKLILDI